MHENSASEYAQALDRLTRYLALRDHSRFELANKLKRHFASDLVTQLLNEAEERGWLLAEEVVSERAALAWRRKLKSQRYIEMQLKRRRLPPQPRDDAQELQNMRALVERKFALTLDGSRKIEAQLRVRIQRYLQTRGFAPRLIGMVFNAQEL